MEATGFDAWALSLAVFLPLIGVGVMALFPKEQEETHKLIALVTSLVALAMGIYLLANYDFDRGDELQFLVDNSWIDVINSRYIIGIDGISLPLLILSLAVIPLCIIYSWNHIPEPGNPKAFLMLILILATGMNGTFVAQDLILFFVFFEVVLLPMYFMIGVWGGDDRRYASIKFFLYTLFGSALMIISFLALFFLSQEQTFDMRLLTEFQGEGIARASQLWVFAGMFMGFGSKVPMFPFHTWLPDAHTQAPTVGSVILAAVLLKLGTYGFVRIAIPMLPEAAAEWAPWIGLLAVIGIIYGALGCLAQTDMKRLIAFSSVAHMGFVMLGISTMTDFGINAAIFGMVAHGLITGMLFFLAGSIKERYHTLEIARLGGLLLSAYSPAPTLPVETFRTFMVIDELGTVLAAGYLLWLFQRTAFGTPKEEWDGVEIEDVTTVERVAWTPFLLFIVVFGVLPGLLFGVTDDAVAPLMENVSELLVRVRG